MTKIEIPPMDLALRPFHQWDKGWFALTAGDFAAGKFNSMTVSWGSFGIMWGRPFAQAVVRPTRFTYGLMEEYDNFTLCAFPEQYRKALNIFGSKSGRDGDKISAAGLTPAASKLISSPAFAEAELIFECRKIYVSKFDPAGFQDPAIDSNYSGGDYHQVYFGQVLRIYGDEKYLA
ncbi:MAG: flavin reductase [Anaerolineales bacterium]|nr:flavin reductase [Anaerolineales bacterium]